MATLREKLDAAIANQQGEVDRMVDVAKVDLPKAQAVLAQLQGLAGQLDKNPDVEARLRRAEGAGREVGYGVGDSMPIDKPFAYHAPSDVGLTRITWLREAFSPCKAAIEANAPPSRERAVALTELETSAMWAIKAVVFNDPDSTVQP